VWLPLAVGAHQILFSIEDAVIAESAVAGSPQANGDPIAQYGAIQ